MKETIGINKIFYNQFSSSLHSVVIKRVNALLNLTRLGIHSWRYEKIGNIGQKTDWHQAGELILIFKDHQTQILAARVQF